MLQIVFVYVMMSFYIFVIIHEIQFEIGGNLAQNFFSDAPHVFPINFN